MLVLGAARTYGVAMSSPSPALPVRPADRAEILAALKAAARERVLVLDGAMGTMIQQLKLDESGYRGERFKDWPRDVRGNNDLLNLSQPDAVRDIHLQYFLAGADIVEINTFASPSVGAVAITITRSPSSRSHGYPV